MRTVPMRLKLNAFFTSAHLRVQASLESAAWKLRLCTTIAFYLSFRHSLSLLYHLYVLVTALPSSCPALDFPCCNSYPFCCGPHIAVDPYIEARTYICSVYLHIPEFFECVRTTRVGRCCQSHALWAVPVHGRKRRAPLTINASTRQVRGRPVGCT